MSFNRRSDEGSISDAVFSGLWTLTAASTNDNTVLTGTTIDRLGFESAKIIYTYHVALTSAKTFSTQVKVTDYDGDGVSAYAAYETSKAAGVIETANGGGAESYDDVLEYNVDLASANRYIKIATCNDFNHTSSDNGVVSVVVVLYGASSIVAS